MDFKRAKRRHGGSECSVSFHVLLVNRPCPGFELYLEGPQLVLKLLRPIQLAPHLGHRVFNVLHL